MATAIVDLIHGQGVGQEQRSQFERVFSKKKIPDDVPIYSYSSGDSLIEVLTASGLLSSKSEARRMLSQGGVSFVEGGKITDDGQCFDQGHDGKVLKVGKRKFLRLKWKAQTPPPPTHLVAGEWTFSAPGYDEGGTGFCPL